MRPRKTIISATNDKNQAGVMRLLVLAFIGVFIAGAAFGILIIGLMAANEELERKEKRK